MAMYRMAALAAGSWVVIFTGCDDADRALAVGHA